MIFYNLVVVGMSSPDRADLVFHALGDSTRRDIVRRTIGAEHSVSHLAAHYPMSFAGVQKHVAVLERARLVLKRKSGREQLVRANLDAIRAAQALLDRFEDIWRSRIERFGEVLAETEGGAHR